MRPFLLSGLLSASCALLPRSAVAESSVPPPAAELISRTIPSNGVALFQVGPAAPEAQIVVRERQSGREISGTKSLRFAGYVVWIPSQPLVPGRTYDVTTNVGENLSERRTELSVEAAVIDPALDLSVELTSEAKEVWLKSLCCNGGFAPRGEPVPGCVAEETTQEMRTLARHVTTTNELTRSQYFIALDFDAIPAQVQPWAHQLPSSGPHDEQGPVEHCVQARAIELRTGKESRGPRVCKTVEADTTVYKHDITQALDARTCMSPDHEHQDLWCDHNEQLCSQIHCPQYWTNCEMRKEGLDNWIDAGNVAAPPPTVNADAKAADGGAASIEPARHARHQACSIQAPGRGSVQWPVFFSVAFAGLLASRRRRRGHA